MLAFLVATHLSLSRIATSTPATLGRDRLAAAVGAEAIYGVGDRLIVDLGTAITIDTMRPARGVRGVE